MKKSKFTEQQIVFAIKQADNGVKVDEICRPLEDNVHFIEDYKKSLKKLRGHYILSGTIF